MAWFYASLIKDGSGVLINTDHICSVNVNVNDTGVIDEKREFFFDVRTTDGHCYELEDPESCGAALLELLAVRTTSQDSRKELEKMGTFIRERYITLQQELQRKSPKENG